MLALSLSPTFIGMPLTLSPTVHRFLCANCLQLTYNRSLVTTLRAAELFEPSHLSSPEIQPLIDGATHFYIGGFFLTHGLESALLLAKQASKAGKTVALNLSAPFIVQFFKVQLEELLPYADIVIGNESEAGAYATANGSTARIPI